MQRIGKLLWSTIYLYAGLSLTGCIKEEPPVVSQSTAAIQASDSAQMYRLYTAWTKTHPEGGAMPLNFGNEFHYRVIVNRLRAAGKTADNSPELFSRIAGAKLRAQNLADVPPADWCGQEIPFANATTGDYSAASMIGCTGGTDYSSADINTYAATTELTDLILLTSGFNDDFEGKFLETDPVAGRTEPGPGRILFMESVAMAFDATHDFAGYLPALAALAVPNRASSLTLDHPHEIQGGAPDNPIRVCLFRDSATAGVNHDCDYGTVRKDATNHYFPFDSTANGIAAAIPTPANQAWAPNPDAFFASNGTLVPQNGSPVIAYLPLQGTYDAGALNTDDCDNTETKASASLFLLQTGGKCAGKLPGDVVGTVTLPWTTNDMNQARLGFRGLLDFGQTCVGLLQDVKLTIKITNDRGSCGQGRGKTIDTTTIDFRNSCLAEGSAIALGSGKSVPVEKLAAGDQVVANTKGTVLTVQGVSHGFEPFPMVRLKDDKGHQVTVTAKHPMLLDGGTVIAADKLAVGDKVLTNKGAARLVTVERVKHAGKVYNFLLGSEQELAALGPDERTLFANGFLVGDNVMQHRVEDREKEAARLAVQIPSAWRRDYEHAAARKSVAANK